MSLIKYTCQNCRAQTPKWQGKCYQCNTWNSLEEIALVDRQRNHRELRSRLKRAHEISGQDLKKLETGINQIDNLFGNGITSSSSTLFTGGPGAGKSSLLLWFVNKLLETNENISALYVSGEETLEQLASRVNRLNITNEKLYLLETNNWEDIVGALYELRPKIIVIDSVQTIISSEVLGSMGSAPQSKEIAYNLTEYVKENKAIGLLIAQINKQGQTAGPKMLEHIVDTIIEIKRSSSIEYREIKCTKNRYGNTDQRLYAKINEKEIIIFNEEDKKKHETSVGTVYGEAVINGIKKKVEIQTLIKNTTDKKIISINSGYPKERLRTLIMILDNNLGINLSEYNIYLKIGERYNNHEDSLDLCIAVSLISAYFKKSVMKSVSMSAKIKLNGEIVYPEEQQIAKSSCKKVRSVINLCDYLEKL